MAALRLYAQVTDACDAGCRHCGFDCQPPPGARLEPGLLARFIRECRERWGPSAQLALTGGEPMLEPDRVEELARVGRLHDLRVWLLTHGGWAAADPDPRRTLRVLREAGVAALWISAGFFHDEVVPAASRARLLEAAGAVELPVHLHFAYLHPLSPGMRGRGLPGLDGRIPADGATHAAQTRLEASGLPGVSCGWGRIWEQGRARRLFAELPPAQAAEVRADLVRARASGEGTLDDTLGLGLGGELFYREAVIGRSDGRDFSALLARVELVRA